MANFFRNNTQAQSIDERRLLESRYQSYRHELLFMVFCTVINAILLLTNSNVYFLFSAFIPHLLIDLGMFLCGKYPAPVYEDLDGLQFMNDSFLVIMCVLAAIALSVYVLCWVFSKKRVGWLWAALVFVSIDTLALFLIGGFDRTMILDYLFHALFIYYLILGIITHRKLKNLPEEDLVLEGVEFEEAPAETIETVEAVETAEATEEAKDE